MKKACQGCARIGWQGLLLVGLFAAGSLRAADNSWINAGDGFWDIAGNWSAGVAPSNNFDSIWISNAVSKTITLDQTSADVPGVMTINNLKITGAGTVTNTLFMDTGSNPTPLRVLNETHIGEYGNGQFTLSSGTFLGNDFYIAYGSGSTGTLNMLGGTNVLTGQLSIGRYGTGHVWLQSGLLVVTNNATSIGRAGVGQMTISNGTFIGGQVYLGYWGTGAGTLNMAGGTARMTDLTLGNTLGATGIVNVTGGQLTAAGTINIGANAYGELNISGGTVEAQQLLATDGYLSQFTLNGGTLISHATTINNGNDLIVGDTGGGATFQAVGGTHNVAGMIFVGNTSSGNQMLISNGASVVNSDYGVIGEATSARNNAVTVTGSGSTWSNGADLYVGDFGSGNSLTIANGGTVNNGYAYIGNRISSSNNAVTVSGLGSTWNCGDYLFLGNSGAGNQLTISNGGKVFNGSGYLGYWGSGNNNSALVTGNNSVWSNRSNLYIGDNSANNQLHIIDGGKVYNDKGYIGYGSASSNNYVEVIGNDSLWQNRSGLSLGGYMSGGAWVNGGTGNQLQVGNGGVVSVGAVDLNGFYGYYLDYGYYLYSALLVGDRGGGNPSLIIGNGSQVNADNLILGLSAAETGSVLISGSNSSLQVYSGDIFVGCVGSGNQMQLSNGGWVDNSYRTSIIGYQPGSSNNSVLVSDSGSCWNTSQLYVGHQGSGNHLTISNGGRVYVTDYTTCIGYQPNSSNNTVLVTGVGSLWDNSQTGWNDWFFVGDAGSGNQLTVADAGRVISRDTMIGPSGNSNSVRVTGAGSLWLNKGALYLGGSYDYTYSQWHNGGVGNTLTVESNGWVNVMGASTNGLPELYGEGGLLVGGAGGTMPGLLIANGSRVNSGDAYLGYASNETAMVLLTGSNSVWQTRSLSLGYWGSNNQLVITNGGRMDIVSGQVAASYMSHDNSILVSDTGAEFRCFDFSLGLNGDNNKLTILSGGRASADYYHTYSDSNTVRVSGNGSVLQASVQMCLDGSIDSSGRFYPGMARGNQVTVESNGWVLVGNVATNALSSLEHSSGGLLVGDAYNHPVLAIGSGAHVISGTGYIGSGTNETGMVLVSGTDAIWNNNGSLYVGYNGSGNNLIVTNSGYVNTVDLALGCADEGARNNSVVVTGTGSLLNVQSLLTIGTSGSGNRLNVRNGGQVVDQFGSVGLDSSSSNNNVVVEGTGSVWSNKYGMYLGYNGAGNCLVVSNGGTVISANSRVGYQSGSSNNSVIISGFASTWTDSGILYVGGSGNGNQLIVSNNGVVSSLELYLASAGNLLTVDGGSLTVSEGLSVGFNGANNGLIIEHGGKVFSAGGGLGVNSSSSNNYVSLMGTGSVWSNAYDLVVGDYGGGGNHIDLGYGSTLYASNLFIGRGVGESSLNNSGGSVLLAGNMSIGSSGATGTVRMTSGLLDDSAGLVQVGVGHGKGDVRIYGGSMLAGDLMIGPTGSVTVTGGMLGFGGTHTLGASGVFDSAGTLNLWDGILEILPSGQLQVESSVNNFVSSIQIINQGVLQVQAGSFAFKGGLDNQGSFSVAPSQLVSVKNGLGNEGTLTVGMGGALTADSFAGNEHSGTMFLNSGASLTVNSVWTNSGAVELAGATVGGSTIQNADLIEGAGALNASLVNRAGGTVRASGGLLALNGAALQNLPGGFLEAESGATLRLNRGLANQGVLNNLGGMVDMQSNTLTNQGAITGYGTFKAGKLLNQGVAQFEGGNLSMQATYLNSASATTVVSHVTAIFYGAVTNNFGGYMKNTGSQITYMGAFYNDGSYVSDPATNIYASTVQLGTHGTLSGGVGDLFVLEAGLTSLNPDGLDLAQSAVKFTDGAQQLSLAGIGKFGDLQLTGGAGLTLSGANLFVGLFEGTTNQLTTADIIFYDPVQNPGLGGQTFALNGGGFLQAIPEPGIVGALFLFGAGLLGWRRLRRWGT